MDSALQKKILVVEDDKDLRNILVGELKAQFNYEVLEAEDGQQAVDLAIGTKPSLILLDLLLPKLDGFQVLDRVRHNADPLIAQVKVVILSNLWSNKDILRAQALKIDEYYVKANTKLEVVFAKVKEIMGGVS